MFKNIITILALLIISTQTEAQIIVDKGGDGWSVQVDSALTLIKKTSPKHWQIVEESCNHISMWNGTVSTTQPDPGLNKGTIVISKDDFKLGSINNIASVIVHESRHLWISRMGIKFHTVNLEESHCYLWELEFLQTIPNVEPWLVQHVFNQFIGNTKHK